MNNQTATIPDNDTAWDDRSLGADEHFVVVVDQDEDALIEEAAGTQLISIRMSKGLIEDYKMIAAINGNMGYQTLMKQILHRFAESEKKRILTELVSEKLKERSLGPKSNASRKPTEATKRKASQKKVA